jgi:hypothetical protein
MNRIEINAAARRVATGRTAAGRATAGVVAIGLATALLLMPGAAQASGVNGINGGMPNRISMNVTVPKQTQGATFGEKVNAGLHAAGSAVAQGASSSIVIECGQVACAIGFPNGSGYRAETRRMTVRPLVEAEVSALRKSPLVGGASLLGGALPGGAVISAAVSSVGKLAGGIGGGAAAASYARFQHGDIRQPVVMGSARREDGHIDVLDPLVDGNYVLTLVVEKGTSGLKDTLKTQVRAAVTQQVRIEVGFSVEAGVMNPLFEGNGNTGSNPLHESSK